jgi:transposase
MGVLFKVNEREEWISRHRGERDGRVKDRIKAVLWYDEGHTISEIAYRLFLSEEGVRGHINDFIRSKKVKPENGGSVAQLVGEAAQRLLAHLDDVTYTDVREICAYVQKRFNVLYSRSGMTAWLHRHGFTFHQPCGVPAKADGARQAAFIKMYEELKRTLPDNAKIYFLDGVHPTHQTRLVAGWIRRGCRKQLPMTPSQKRVNILGAIDLEGMNLVTKRYDTLNGEAVVDFLKHLRTQDPHAVLHVINDRGRYNTCPVVAEALEKLDIVQHLLPPYSPNLNVIERCWKIMHEHVTNNTYYPTFTAFSNALDHFFNVTFKEKARSFIDRLTDNFTPIHSQLIPHS